MPFKTQKNIDCDVLIIVGREAGLKAAILSDIK
jgi:hypothetical protein